jgi:hypothetical protein
MRTVCVVCEGPTEAEFVRACLAPHLLEHNLLVHASILQARSGGHRGGRVTVERLGKHLAREYYNADRITTLVDYYGFQDRGGRSRTDLESSILQEVQKWAHDRFDSRFVLPYVQMYEFEALLFADIDGFQLVLDGWSPVTREQLKRVRDAFANPEEIDDSPQTAPSKRILTIFDNGEYSKTEHGPLIAETIGLSIIREQCPGFAAWLSHLERWGIA